MAASSPDDIVNVKARSENSAGYGEFKSRQHNIILCIEIICVRCYYVGASADAAGNIGK